MRWLISTVALGSSLVHAAQDKSIVDFQTLGAACTAVVEAKGNSVLHIEHVGFCHTGSHFGRTCHEYIGLTKLEYAMLRHLLEVSGDRLHIGDFMRMARLDHSAAQSRLMTWPAMVDALITQFGESDRLIYRADQAEFRNPVLVMSEHAERSGYFSLKEYTADAAAVQGLRDLPLRVLRNVHEKLIRYFKRELNIKPEVLAKMSSAERENLSLESLRISPRTLRPLQEIGIRNVRQLRETPDQVLLAQPGVSQRELNIIALRLETLQLPRHPENFVFSINPDVNTLLARLGFGHHALRLLKRLGYNTWGDLLQMPFREAEMLLALQPEVYEEIIAILANTNRPSAWLQPNVAAMDPREVDQLSVVWLRTNDKNLVSHLFTAGVTRIGYFRGKTREELRRISGITGARVDLLIQSLKTFGIEIAS